MKIYCPNCGSEFTKELVAGRIWTCNTCNKVFKIQWFSSGYICCAREYEHSHQYGPDGERIIDS